MTEIIEAIKQGGPFGFALVFVALWYMEVKERWDREKEFRALHRMTIRALERFKRVTSKLAIALGQADDDLDDDAADDADA